MGKSVFSWLCLIGLVSNTPVARPPSDAATVFKSSRRVFVCGSVSDTCDL